MRNAIPVTILVSVFALPASADHQFNLEDSRGLVAPVPVSVSSTVKPASNTVGGGGNLDAMYAQINADYNAAINKVNAAGKGSKSPLVQVGPTTGVKSASVGSPVSNVMIGAKDSQAPIQKVGNPQQGDAVDRKTISENNKNMSNQGRAQYFCSNPVLLTPTDDGVITTFPKGGGQTIKGTIKLAAANDLNPFTNFKFPGVSLLDQAGGTAQGSVVIDATDGGKRARQLGIDDFTYYAMKQQDQQTVRQTGDLNIDQYVVRVDAGQAAPPYKGCMTAGGGQAGKGKNKKGEADATAKKASAGTGANG